MGLNAVCGDIGDPRGEDDRTARAAGAAGRRTGSGITIAAIAAIAAQTSGDYTGEPVGVGNDIAVRVRHFPRIYQAGLTASPVIRLMKRIAVSPIAAGRAEAMDRDRIEVAGAWRWIVQIIGKPGAAGIQLAGEIDHAAVIESDAFQLAITVQHNGRDFSDHTRRRVCDHVTDGDDAGISGAQDYIFAIIKAAEPAE